eukprot:gnl/Trimastix_PCT/1367.p3 GENE.gnl/Trimastix_PCT/1367~~gnl/Trimastix_PCT/1367.p3  ORF type:complete len:370 (+),score=123.46 gnl/Trimastix_PCT/1367:1707-2816(+)
MRITRLKKAKKALMFYRIVFGFRPPFFVILTPDFIEEFVRRKFNLASHLSKLFEGKVIFCVTPCIVNEIRREGTVEALNFARKCRLFYCGHAKDPYRTHAQPPMRASDHQETTLEDDAPRYIVHRASNEDSDAEMEVEPSTPSPAQSEINLAAGQNRWTARGCCLDLAEGYQKPVAFAVQDPRLRGLLRLIPGVPLVYMNLNCAILDPPSRVCKQFAERAARTQQRKAATSNRVAVKRGPSFAEAYQEFLKQTRPQGQRGAAESEDETSGSESEADPQAAVDPEKILALRSQMLHAQPEAVAAQGEGEEREGESKAPPRPVRRKPKGPNPLSAKKKKKGPAVTPKKAPEERAKRRRVRKKPEAPQPIEA